MNNKQSQGIKVPLTLRKGTKKSLKGWPWDKNATGVFQGIGMLSLLITEFDVQALVDSHLTWEEEKRVWQGICSNPALKDYYVQIIAQKKLLAAWWQSQPPKDDDKTPSR